MDFGDVFAAYFQGWRDGYGKALDDLEEVLDKNDSHVSRARLHSCPGECEGGQGPIQATSPTATTTAAKQGPTSSPSAPRGLGNGFNTNHPHGKRSTFNA